MSSPVIAASANGDIFVSSPLGLTQISGDGTQVLIPSVTNPRGAVTDSAGNLYVADGTTNEIVKIAPDGTQTIFATGLNAPKDLALDPSGNLFVANSGTNSVLQIAPDGSKTTFASGLHGPRGVAFDSTGNLFVSNKGTNTIVKIASDGMKSTFVSAGLNSPGGLAFDATGNLLVADTGSDTIVRVAPDGTTSALVSTGLNGPTDVAVDGLGNLLVADSGSNSILKVAPNGTVSTLASPVIGPQYIVQASSVHQLLNLSTRGYVETGDHVLIGGFIVRGTPVGDLGRTTVVVRAIGPSLSDAGVSDPLMDPVIELHDSAGTLIATNDNWKDSQQTEIKATGLAPTDAREAAIEAFLPDGSYTAIVRGTGGSTGVALVEAYKVQ
ncbi:MAG: virginiamycin B lyase family protein [Chthoniobacterales bacterium]